MFLLEQHKKVIRGCLKGDWATELWLVSEGAQAAADRGELRLVYQRRRPKALRSVTFPDGSVATSEQEVAGAWLRVFAEKLGGQVAEGASRDHDGDVEPEGCALTPVAAGGGAEWAPSRANIAEAILSVGSDRGVSCDMVPVKLLKCSPPSSARIVETLFAKISAQTLLPHAWRGCLEVTVPKTRGSLEKRGVGPEGLVASGGSQRQVSMRLVC